jgi:hypothetical protein
MWVAIGYLSGIAMKTLLRIWRSGCECQLCHAPRTRHAENQGEESQLSLRVEQKAVCQKPEDR